MCMSCWHAPAGPAPPGATRQGRGAAAHRIRTIDALTSHSPICPPHEHHRTPSMQPIPKSHHALTQRIQMWQGCHDPYAPGTSHADCAYASMDVQHTSD